MNTEFINIIMIISLTACVYMLYKEVNLLEREVGELKKYVIIPMKVKQEMDELLEIPIEPKVVEETFINTKVDDKERIQEVEKECDDSQSTLPNDSTMVDL